MRKLKFYELNIILFIIICIAFVSHFTLIDRVGFWRFIYPVQAKFDSWNIKCSKDTPVWVKEGLKYIIENQKNLSNQIAYIDRNRHMYTCQSGWKGIFFFSEKINENTRFRYASLTKLFTSDAILNQINNSRLEFDSKLLEFLPELQKTTLKDNQIKDITIGQLLEHRSGFDRMRSEDVVFAINKKSWCPYNLRQLAELKLDFNPGQRYAYDNRNYCLLGIILERLENKNYRDYINKKYLLSQKNIKFVDGEYFSDEVKYDFRNSDFWMDTDDNDFDFKALSSSAGLSGSAKQLASSITTMLDSKPYNILSINKNTFSKCNIYKFKSCNGYGMWQYRASQKQPIMYFRNGGLPAVTSLAIVTESNEVIVWIGNGTSLYNKNYDENLLEKYFYEVLNE